MELRAALHDVLTWSQWRFKSLRMTMIRSICVYCGSANGSDPVFTEEAVALSTAMAKSGIRLIYGGGSIGLMGATARAVLEAGGEVTGIIPDFLKQRESLLKDVQETVIVPDMHTRKRLMFERADAFVALPGGIGTLEELVEQLTWSQLGRHKKPILILDTNGFWRPLLSLFAHMNLSGFIRPGLNVTYLVAEKADDIIPMLDTAARRAAGLEEEPEAAVIAERF